MVQKVYFPDDVSIQIHQSRVTRCQLRFPAGYYWYGNKRKGPGHPPKWVNNLLTTGEGRETPQSQTDSPLTDVESQSEEPGVCDSDSQPVQQEVEAESIPVRAGTERYGLRGQVSPPEKLMRVDTFAQDELVQRRE